VRLPPIVSKLTAHSEPISVEEGPLDISARIRTTSPSSHTEFEVFWFSRFFSRLAFRAHTSTTGRLFSPDRKKSFLFQDFCGGGSTEKIRHFTR
jgi:hypothetical protein